MSIVNIVKAKREGAKIVIGLGGVSGSGKTYSALQLGKGIVNGDMGKLGFLDTENKRGTLYADEFPGFLHGDFQAPFSPARYIEAIRQFENAGCECLIIDSGSHEWEGIGGCLEIAASGGKAPRWDMAKTAHKTFMNALLQASMHIIICFRAREKVKIEKDNSGKTVYIPQGLQIITESNVEFELTAFLMMEDSGKKQQVLKCPAAWQGILGRGKGYLTEEDGKSIREWVDGGVPVDRSLDRYKSCLLAACENGIEALRAAWGKIPKEYQLKLKDDLETYKKSAEAYETKADTVNESEPIIFKRIVTIASVSDEGAEIKDDLGKTRWVKTKINLNANSHGTAEFQSTDEGMVIISFTEIKNTNNNQDLDI